jgi:hypothetical protein
VGPSVVSFGRFRAGPLRAGTTGPPPPKLPGEVGCGAGGGELRAVPRRPPPGRHHRPTSPETAGGGWAGGGVLRRVECGMVGRPPPRPSPANCAGEGGATHLVEAGSKSTSPRGFWGRCEPKRVRGPPADAVRFSFVDAPDPSATFSPLREERAGRGRGRGPLADAVRCRSTNAQIPSLPPSAKPAVPLFRLSRQRRPLGSNPLRYPSMHPSQTRLPHPARTRFKPSGPRPRHRLVNAMLPERTWLDGGSHAG